MRHLKRNAKLGRKGAHRNAMLANMVCSLIKNKRVTTTLAKAKAVRPVAEKMVTLGKKGSIHHRRLAASRLHQEDAVQILFNEIAPGHQDRAGGYTRIIKLHERRGDAAQMAQSLKQLAIAIQDSTVICSGHDYQQCFAMDWHAQKETTPLLAQLLNDQISDTQFIELKHQHFKERHETKLFLTY